MTTYTYYTYGNEDGDNLFVGGDITYDIITFGNGNGDHAFPGVAISERKRRYQ